MRGRVITTVVAATLAVPVGLSMDTNTVEAAVPLVPHIELDLLLTDVVDDPTRDVFYASTRPDSPEAPDRIVTVDVNSGDVIDSDAIDGTPGSLAVSSDGSALYVGNNDTGMLQKRSLPDLELEWSVSPDPRSAGRIDIPEDIEVSPIDPDYVVASFRTPGISPGHAGVIAATDGAILENSTPDHTGPNRIEFTDDPSRLVGYYNNSTAFSFWALEVDSEGVTREQNPTRVTGGFSTDIEFADGLVVSSAGDIIEPGPPASTTARFDDPIQRSRQGITTDGSTGRAFVIEQQTAGTWDVFLSVHDLRTGERQDYFDVPDSGFSRTEVLRRLSSGAIVLIRDQETFLMFPDVISGSFGEFTPLTPERIVDSRIDLGRENGALRAGETFDVQVGGRGGVPSDDVIAVVLNVTAVAPTADSYLTLFPTGIDQPENSNVNFPAGRAVPNLATIRLGAGGRVSVFNAAGQTHLVVDVAGFYTSAEGVAGSRYAPVDPERLVDTRTGRGGVPATPLGPQATIPVAVTGRSGIPDDATAVAINVTAAAPTASSFLTVYPDDVPRPDASNVNFVPGSASANQAIVRVPDSGILNVYNGGGSTEVIIDVVGYYDMTSTRFDGRFIPVDPVRFLDTRSSSPFPAPGWLGDQDIIFYEPVSDPESALVFNLTVTATSGNGYVVAYPHPGDVPETSSINYTSGRTVANHAMVPVDPSFAFANRNGRTHLIVDIFGYFT